MSYQKCQKCEQPNQILIPIKFQTNERGFAQKKKFCLSCVQSNSMDPNAVKLEEE